MTRYLAVALLPLLAACAAAPPTDPAHARCQQQADQDPAVQALLVKAPAWSSDPQWQENLAMARRKAANDCLVAAGVAPARGGVEPINRTHYGLGWY